MHAFSFAAVVLLIGATAVVGSDRSNPSLATGCKSITQSMLPYTMPQAGCYRLIESLVYDAGGAALVNAATDGLVELFFDRNTMVLAANTTTTGVLVFAGTDTRIYTPSIVFEREGVNPQYHIDRAIVMFGTDASLEIHGGRIVDAGMSVGARVIIADPEVQSPSRVRIYGLRVEYTADTSIAGPVVVDQFALVSALGIYMSGEVDFEMDDVHMVQRTVGNTTADDLEFCRCQFVGVVGFSGGRALSLRISHVTMDGVSQSLWFPQIESAHVSDSTFHQGPLASFTANVEVGIEAPVGNIAFHRCAFRNAGANGSSGIRYTGVSNLHLVDCSVEGTFPRLDPFPLAWVFRYGIVFFQGAAVMGDTSIPYFVPPWVLPNAGISRSLLAERLLVRLLDNESFGIIDGWGQVDAYAQFGVAQNTSEVTLVNSRISGGAVGVVLSPGSNRTELRGTTIQDSYWGVYGVNGSNGCVFRDTTVRRTCVPFEFNANSIDHVLANTILVRNGDVIIDDAGQLYSNTLETGITGECDIPQPSLPVWDAIAAIIFRRRADGGSYGSAFNLNITAPWTGAQLEF